MSSYKVISVMCFSDYDSARPSDKKYTAVSLGLEELNKALDEKWYIKNIHNQGDGKATLFILAK